MTERYWKGRGVLKEYKQGRLVYEKSTSIPDYLCFTALEAGQFTLTIPAAVTPTYLSYVEWSKDGRTWTRLTVDDTAQSVTTPIIPVGGKVYWRGSGSRMAYDYSANKYSVFSSTGTFDVSGDLRSLLFSDDFENVATTNQRYCFTGLFYGASVVNASNLRLALTGNSAYMYCFRGCTQLLHAPALMEGNTIMQWQFHSTYDGCTNLVTGTDLQATSVGVRGCYYTYKSCTSLVKAPNISSITTIGNGGLSAMFHGCSSLTYIKCLATSLYDDGDASHFATYNWVAGVSSTGTFIKDANTTWPTGASGIPSGWIINPDYLCFTALDDNTEFTFTKYINLPNTTIPSISYSLDGGDTWTEVAMSGSGNEDIVTTPAVNAGGKVLWKAEAGRFALATDKYSTFTANGRFNVSGNIMSLLYGDNHYDKTDTRAYSYTFGSLFRDSVNLIDASQLKLPTGRLNAGDLLGLFRGCTSLVHGAPLYAPNIPDSCCYWMYYGCTSMTEMPTIAATSMLKDNGDPCNYGLYYAFYNCSNMEGEVKLNIVGDVGQQVLDACFSNCSKITSADLAFNGALGKMALRGAFVGCTLLSHVKCLATSFYDDGTAANGSLYNWMNNVSRTGTFIQASGVTWPRGKSGIPDNWTIETQTP